MINRSLGRLRSGLVFCVLPMLNYLGTIKNYFVKQLDDTKASPPSLGLDQWEVRLLQFHIWKHQYQYWEFIFFSRYFLVVLLMEHSENCSISISKGLFGTHSIYICQILSISNFLAEHQYYLESIPDTIPGAPSYGRRTWMRSLLLAPWTSGHRRGAVMKMTHERNHWGHLR